MEATKIYEGVCGELLFVSKKNILASTDSLETEEGREFLKRYFSPGELVQTLNGIQMIDRNYNCMKAGFHVNNPEKAKQLAGI